MSVSPGEAQIVLLPDDDFMHPLEDAPNFNESAYYNFINHSAPTVGGWVRLGNRANEGYAEMTVCLYEPGGGIAFAFQRAPIADNRAHDAGGARFEVIEPWKEHRVTYRGQVCVMRNPLDLSNPSVAFKTNPFEAADVDIRWFGLSPGWGGEARVRDAQGVWRAANPTGVVNQFARGHFEQLGVARGHMRIGDRAYAIDGYGCRDHSWGPRYWQNTGPYQWLLMNFADQCGLMALRQEQVDGSIKMDGFFWEKGRANRNIVKIEIDTEYAPPEDIHHRMAVRFWLEGEDAPRRVTGEVLTPAPCRNRRDGWVTRITEGLSRWRMDNMTGYGIAEYLVHLKRGDGA
jgi:hypothetical protein